MSGPLLSVSAMKKALLTIVTAVAWFLPGHLVIVALLVLIWGSAMVSTANTAATRALKTRVDGVVTQLGTTNTNVTAAQSTASSAASTASAAQTTANNALPASGGTVSGNLTITGSLTVDTNLGVHGGTTLVGSSSCTNDFTVGTSLTVDSNLGVHGNTSLVGSLSVSGNAAMPNGSIGSASAPPNGTGGASMYCGNFYTGSGAAVWAQDISNTVDAIISALSVNGVTN